MPKHALPIALLVILAGHVRAGGRQDLRAPALERQASADIEQLVKQALEDRLAARNLPDGNLLGKATRIAIREAMPQMNLRLGPGALPERAGYEFYLISEAAAQAAADNTRQAVYFITVDRVVINGDTATVSLGVDVVFPRIAKLDKLCCCTASGSFRRVDGRWRFVKWSDYVWG